MSTSTLAHRRPSRGQGIQHRLSSRVRYAKLSELDEATRRIVAEFTTPRRGFDGELVFDLSELGELGTSDE